MKNNSLHLATMAMLASTSFVTPALIAAEYVVNTPTNVTNGDAGNIVDGDDTLTVTETGSISTILANTDAINTTNNNNIINNAGALSTAGISAEGIVAGNENRIINSGTISTVGDFSEGIIVGNENSIFNTGTISTTGLGSEGIQALDGNIAINNSGTISTIGNFGIGIFALDNNVIINNGTISTTGTGAMGIAVVNNNPAITNTGRILTTGINSAGIQVFRGNVVNNSGYVVATQAQSFFFLDAFNTLNLMAPSFIGGEIDMGENSIVNITTGRSQSVLWDFSTYVNVPIMGFGGDVPWAWNAVTEQFATLDPTALSAAPDVLGDQIGALSDLTRMNGAADYNEWWIRGFGSYSEYGAQGIFNDYTSINGGIAAGGSFVLGDNLSLGAMIGYQATRLNVNSAWMQSQSVEGNGIVGSVSANTSMDAFFADFTIFGGTSANTSSRLVNDNLAALGVDYANANYNSWFIAPELRIGMDIETDGVWIITPSATARYSIQQVAAYVETGSNANATIGARSVQVFEGNVELAATREIGNGFATIRGGVQYRQNAGGPGADITLLGQALAMPVDTSAMLAGYIGADVSFEHAGPFCQSCHGSK